MLRIELTSNDITAFRHNRKVAGRDGRGHYKMTVLEKAIHAGSGQSQGRTVCESSRFRNQKSLCPGKHKIDAGGGELVPAGAGKVRVQTSGSSVTADDFGGAGG